MTQALGPVEVTFVLPIGGGGAPVPWRYLTANGHTAEFLNAANVVVLSASFGVDYTISPDADTAANVGTLTLLKAAPVTATKLVLRRKTAKVQNYVATPGAEGIETQLDRLTLVAQETDQTAGGSTLSALEALWLGPKSADPTLDNQGNALLAGAIYFNTVTLGMRVWNGTAWSNVSGAGSQPADAGLSALAALVYAANKGIYATGPDAFALYDLSAFGRSFSGSADQAAARTALSLGDLSILNFLTFAFLDPSAVITDVERLFLNKVANAVPTAKSVTDAMDAFLIVVDEKAAGTNGGTFTLGAWRTRALNTVRENSIVGASVAANQISLPAGKFRVRASAPALRCGNHKSRLQNITDATTALVGTTLVTEQSGAIVQNESTIVGIVTIAAPKTFELQHRSTQTQASDGFGSATNLSEVEVYSVVEIQQIG